MLVTHSWSPLSPAATLPRVKPTPVSRYTTPFHTQTQCNSRPAQCVVKGCRRKPYYPQIAHPEVGGEHEHATTPAPHPTHCRGHRPDACASPQGAPSSLSSPSSPSSKKQNQRKTTPMAIALAAAPAEPGEREEGIWPSTTTPPTPTTPAMSPSLAPPTKKMSFLFACRFEGCSKRASHGVERNKRPTHCPAHRDPTTMLADHRHRLCDVETDPPCVRQASYGWPGVPAPAAAAVVAMGREPEPTHVANIANRNNNGAKSSTKRATTATTTPATKRGAQQQPLFCAAHRKVGMVDLRNSRGCAAEGCIKRPTHAFDRQKAKFCAAHREVGMLNVVTTVSNRSACRSELGDEGCGKLFFS